MLDRSDLHAYQNRSVEFIKERKRCGLFLDMGLGKTASSLTAIADLIDDLEVGRVLVIAPLRVANSVWASEARKWRHTEHLRVSVATGSARDRLAALQRSADVYVINRENVMWLVKALGAKWPFDMVVIDESSSFKDPSSKRFKALRSVLTKTNYMLLLTGTPSPNSLLDVWAQMFLIDFGKALGRTVTSYRQRFFQQDYTGFNWKIRGNTEAEAIRELMKPATIHMSAEDYLDVPPRINLTEIVELPAPIMARYLDFEKTLLAELPDGEEVEAATAAVLANKLLQWSNGAAYTDDKKNWSEIHTAKLDALAEVAEDNPGETILVAYNYRHDLERLQKRFPSAVVLDKTQETIDRWNRGEIKMLLAHPQSAGHGLNLQHGGSLIVWFGLTWSLEYYQQFNARLHRQGQVKPVRVLHIVCDGTIDKRVLSVLSGKQATQAGLLSALKRE